jgi:hypothetical protein
VPTMRPHQVLDGLCKALGLPDGLPVYAVRSEVTADAPPTIEVCFYPDEKYAAAVREWVEANRDRVLLRVSEADPSVSAVGRNGVLIHRRGQ